VLATPSAKQPIAVVIPNESSLRQVLGSAAEGKDLVALCRAVSVKGLMLKECNAVGKKADFKPMEMLLAVVLTPNEWTPQNGLLTAAHKIERRKIADAFATDIKVRGDVACSSSPFFCMLSILLALGRMRMAWIDALYFSLV